MMSHKKIKLDPIITSKPITFHINIKNDYESQVREELFNSGKDSDLELVVGEEDNKKTFKVHRLILITGSKVLKERLEANKDTKVIHMPEMTPENFEILMKAIYLHRFDLKSYRAASEYAKLFEEFGLKSAAQECVEYLHASENLTEDTSISIYETTENNPNNTQISQECLKLFRENTRDVLASESFYRAHIDTVVKIFEMPELNIRSEIDLLTALETYAAAQNALPLKNPDRFKLYVLPALCCIRFYTVSAAELLTSVAAKALLTPEELLAVVANILVPQNSIYEYPKYFSNSIVHRAMLQLTDASLYQNISLKSHNQTLQREDTVLWDVTDLAKRINPTPSQSMVEGDSIVKEPVGNSTLDPERLVIDDDSVWEPVEVLEPKESVQKNVSINETPVSSGANNSFNKAGSFAPTKKLLKENESNKNNDELWD